MTTAHRATPPDPREQAFTRQAIQYCEASFERSPFFGALAAGTLTAPALRYAFLQYRFFRDQLHRWFGLCMVKAPSGSHPHQKMALMGLADHVFTDLRDGHEVMYDAFLTDLGIVPAEVLRAAPSGATRRYVGSFVEDFGAEDQDFFVALAALSGRELCVSLRNRRLLAQYFAPRQMTPPTWLALHAELELDHFLDAIRPVLLAHEPDSPALLAVEAGVRLTIDRHVALFDELLDESRSA